MARNRITLYTPDQALARDLEGILKGAGFRILVHREIETLLGVVYNDPPDLIVMDTATRSGKVSTLIRQLKADCYFSAIPVLGLVDCREDGGFPWDEFLLDDFVYLPPRPSELIARLRLCLKRIRRVFDNNPLTKLPGNTSVQRAIEAAIGRPYAVCYIDINHFKPYNDVYGFTRGDEVLRMLARIMFNAVRETCDGFSGHVGGDDFVFIVPFENARGVCEKIIENFTAISVDLFDGPEKERGYFVSINRKGEEEHFPLLSIAIAVVPTNLPKIRHCGKVAEMAAELKKAAKKFEKSCFLIDQRMQ